LGGQELGGYSGKKVLLRKERRGNPHRLGLQVRKKRGTIGGEGGGGRGKCL